MRSIATVLLLLISFAAAASPQSQTTDLYDIQIQRVADGVFLASRPDPLRMFVEGNVTIIINEHDVIVVDSGSAPAVARNVISEIRKLTPNPVSFLIITHFHFDHTTGAQEYRKAFPGVTVLSHPHTREQILGPTAKAITDIAASLDSPRKTVDDEIKRVTAEAAPGHEKVVAFWRRYYDDDLPTMQQEFRHTVLTPPSATFENKFVLHRNQRTIEVLFLGAGDTPGDAVVYLPQDRVVVTGDMVVHPIPYGFSAHQAEWTATLARLGELDFDVLIPGHGEAQQGKAYLQKVARLLHSTREQVKAGVAQGNDLEAIRKSVDLSFFTAEYAKDDPLKHYLFRRWFSNPATQRAFTEFGPKTQEATKN